MGYIVGCDIGTTSVKAVAFERNGSILKSESDSYTMNHPEPGYAEQDPEEIFNKTLRVLQNLIEGLGGKPDAVAFSAAMHSLMGLDKEGNPSSPLIIWADNRSGQLADQLRRSEKGKAQYRRTGIPIHAMTPACKLLWVKSNKPAGLYKASRYAGIKDYVIFRLTGQFFTDYSMAAATGLLNLEKLTWDAETLSSVAVEIDQLPEVVSPYHRATVLQNKDYSFLQDVVVVAGGSDGCLANLGSGAAGTDTLALTIGTSGAVRKTMYNRYLDDQMRTFCYPLDKNIFIVGGPTNNGGVVFQWVKDTFFADLSFDEMLKGIAKVEPGASGLLFYPYLLGERAPLWDSQARGCYHGIDIAHSRFHFARAAMEGILMNLYTISQALLEQDEVHTIYANGGFAQSREFVQMLADIFGLKVALNTTNDAGCIGAALIALRALGEIADFSDAKGFVDISETVYPDRDRHKKYKTVFLAFRKGLEEMSLRSLGEA